MCKFANLPSVEVVIFLDDGGLGHGNDFIVGVGGGKRGYGCIILLLFMIRPNFASVIW